MTRYQIKISGPEMRGCAKIREMIVDKLHGNFSASEIKKSEPPGPVGYHCFVNVELPEASRP